MRVFGWGIASNRLRAYDKALVIGAIGWGIKLPNSFWLGQLTTVLISKKFLGKYHTRQGHINDYGLISLG